MVQQSPKGNKEQDKVTWLRVVTDSGLEINSEVLRIYERYRENLSEIDLGSRGNRSGSREHHRDGLVVRTEIK